MKKDSQVGSAGGDADLASGAVGMAAAMEEEREAEQAARQGQQVQSCYHHYICSFSQGPMQAQNGQHLREKPETQSGDLFNVKATWSWVSTCVLSPAGSDAPKHFSPCRIYHSHCFLVPIAQRSTSLSWVYFPCCMLTPQPWQFCMQQPTPSLPVLMQSCHALVLSCRMSCV